MTVLISWSIADPVIVLLAGDHLTPDLLQHFAGPQIFMANELWLPIRQNALLVLLGVVVIIAFTYWVLSVINKAYRLRYSLSLRELVFAMALSILLVLLPYMVQGRFLQYPPEFIYLRNAVGWDLFHPSKQDIHDLRQFLGIEETSVHSEEFPLLIVGGKQEEITKKPNIILLTIESLRASEFSIFNPTDGKISMRSFQAFASEGVLFPYMISNGFPSTEGFLSLCMGVWPHSSDRIILSHQDKNLPNVAVAANSAGYETYRIEEHNDVEEEGFWVQNSFQHHITFSDKGLFPSEKAMIDTLIEIVNLSTFRNTPYYIHLKTRNPHYPYEIADDEKNVFYTIGSPKENYYGSMEVIDKEIFRLFDDLDESGELENTVVIITGDHSNYLDKLHTNNLPGDETVWTGAIIAGPKNLVGRGRAAVHCSHVDISRTIYELIRSQLPWIGVGRSLISNQNTQQPPTLSLRPGGARLDHSGFTHIVARSNPWKYIKTPSFGGRMTNQKRRYDEDLLAITPNRLLDLVDTWTYLVEKNRVYPDHKRYAKKN